MRDNQDSNNEGIVYCSRCGKKNSIHSKFCVNCGNSLRRIEDSIKDSIKDTTKNIKESITNNETYKSFTELNYASEYKADFDNSEMVRFIQKRVEYYIPKFREIQEFYKSTSWNWAAFFFNSCWLLYRKMYGYAAAVIIASMIIGRIPIVGPIVNLGICILCGLYGNVIYLKHIQKQLVSLSSFEEDLRQRLIISRGGVNVVAAVSVYIILTIIGFILVGLAASLYMFSNPFYYYY